MYAWVGGGGWGRTGKCVHPSSVRTNLFHQLVIRRGGESLAKTQRWGEIIHLDVGSGFAKAVMLSPSVESLSVMLSQHQNGGVQKSLMYKQADDYDTMILFQVASTAAKESTNNAKTW